MIKILVADCKRRTCSGYKIYLAQQVQHTCSISRSDRLTNAPCILCDTCLDQSDTFLRWTIYGPGLFDSGWCCKMPVTGLCNRYRSCMLAVEAGSVCLVTLSQRRRETFQLLHSCLRWYARNLCLELCRGCMHIWLSMALVGVILHYNAKNRYLWKFGDRCVRVGGRGSCPL